MVTPNTMQKGRPNLKKYLFLLLSLFILTLPATSPGKPISEEEIKNIIRTYYKACQEKDMQAYLALMHFKNEQEKALAQEQAKSAWEAVNTLNYSLHNFSLTIDKEKGIAIASYTVKADIAPAEASFGEGYTMNATYVMVLRGQDSRWKIDLVQRKDIFMQNLKERMCIIFLI